MELSGMSWSSVVCFRPVAASLPDMMMHKLSGTSRFSRTEGVIASPISRQSLPDVVCGECHPHVTERGHYVSVCPSQNGVLLICAQIWRLYSAPQGPFSLQTWLTLNLRHQSWPSCNLERAVQIRGSFQQAFCEPAPLHVFTGTSPLRSAGRSTHFLPDSKLIQSMSHVAECPPPAQYYPINFIIHLGTPSAYKMHPHKALIARHTLPVHSRSSLTSSSPLKNVLYHLRLVYRTYS